MHDTYLANMLATGRVGQTLLFSGDGVDRAHRLAAELATPFDIHTYRPEGRAALHSIAAMRELQTEVYLNPTNSLHKVFIIEQAERMLSSSANALLKTFEEPPLDTLIILVTLHPERLLPTIRSRCRTLHFPPPPPAKPLPELLHLLNYHPYGNYNTFLQDLTALVDALEALRDEAAPVTFLYEVNRQLEALMWWFHQRWFRQRDGLDGLERVERAVREAREGIARHGKLANCLEAMCVALGIA